jgi:hypothetical protein
MELKDVTIEVGKVEVEPGGLYTVPVTISDLTGLNVIAYEMEVSSGDEAVLADIEDLDETGSLTQGWMEAFNNNHGIYTPDMVRFAVANPYPAVGGGLFFSLKVKGQGVGTYQPKITYFMLNETVISGKSQLDTSIPIPPPAPPAPVPVEPLPAPVPVPTPPVAAPTSFITNVTRQDGSVWGYQYYAIVNNTMQFVKEIAIPANNKEDAEEWNALTGMSIPVPTNSRYGVSSEQVATINSKLDMLQAAVESIKVK